MIPEDVIGCLYRIAAECTDAPFDWLYDEFVGSCERYTCAVATYCRLHLHSLSDPEMRSEFAAQDELRTRSHESLISSANILARALSRAGKDASWIQSLRPSRVHYANFAFGVVAARLVGDVGRLKIEPLDRPLTTREEEDALTYLIAILRPPARETETTSEAAATRNRLGMRHEEIIIMCLFRLLR